jgi:drug/metabolite transporter superfamily protein YnfA
MKTLRGWMALSWIGLLVVMSAGSVLLRRFASLRDGPTSFQAEWLRAGHAHGGVLMLMSLLYYLFIDQTALSIGVKRAASSALLVGILAQFGGFFLHAIVGTPSQVSIGTAVTISGAVLMAGAVTVLVYGLINTRSTASLGS